MIFTPTKLDGAFVVELERREDERGFFARSWCADEFAEHGLDTSIAQCNISFNKARGTLRGLHFQRPPHAEVKLIRCTRGAVFDVVVDLRPASPTYCQWVGIDLTEENGRMIYVPEGFAHGYQTLVDSSETFYQVSAAYAPNAEGGVRWDDPAFAIAWPEVENRIMNERDRGWPDFAA